jgi:predicted ATPase
VTRPANPVRRRNFVEGPWHEGVSLQRWTLENFKSVQHAEISFSPLTLLVGANSAGKSSLLQSILAVSQAAVALGATDRFPLNGGTLRLGTVLQNRYAGPSDEAPETITFGAHFQIGVRARAVGPVAYRRRAFRMGEQHCHVDWHVVLGDAPENQSGQALIESVDLRVRYDAANHGDEEETSEPAHLQVTAHSESAAADQSKPRRVFRGTWTTGARQADLAHVALRGGLPFMGQVLTQQASLLWFAWRDVILQRVERSAGRNRLMHARPVDGPEAEGLDILRDLVIDDIQQMLKEHEDELAGGFDLDVVMRAAFREKYATDLPAEVNPNLMFDPNFAGSVIDGLEKRGITGAVPVRDDLESVSLPASTVGEFLRNNVRYLGPLREDPRVVYQDSAEAANGYVGSKGEFVAAVLQSSGNATVQVPLPGLALGELKMVTLNRAVNDWVRFHEIGESVRTTDQGRLGLELQIRQEHVGIQLDLTSVGTGVSQILPVLVMCLQAAEGSLLMIEQPELHLNPRVQQRLADFLLAIAAGGRQLIVETHSEYLISRLRLRVAKDDSDRVQNTVGLLFAERNQGSTTYRQVETNDYGGLDNWPANFFDQSAEESREILRAAVAKRRKRQRATE